MEENICQPNFASFFIRKQYVWYFLLEAAKSCLAVATVNFLFT
jgi:hypothetical protein